MDNDTISRQAAIEAIDKYIHKFDCIDANFLDGLKTAKEILNDLPSAERRGRWKFNIDDKGWSWDKPYMCDQCGEWAEKVFKFCPNCGARMEV